MKSKFFIILYALILAGMLSSFWNVGIDATEAFGRTKSQHRDSSSIIVSSFTATVIAGNQVELQWECEYGIEFLGYNLYRFQGPDYADSVRVNPTLIASTGNTENPQTYSFIDDELDYVTSYYYLLESLDLNLKREHFGPVSVETGPDGGGTQPVTEIETRLIGAYPNPFNPGTNIRFELEETATVSIAIYNILGQQITSLSQSFNSGKSTLYWDGRDSRGNPCQSGVYFYYFSTTEGYEKYDKMILMK